MKTHLTILLLVLFFTGCKKIEYHNINFKITTDLNEGIVLIYGKRSDGNSISQSRFDTIYNGYLSTHNEVAVGSFAQAKISKPLNVDTVYYEITIKDETTNKELGSKTGVVYNEMDDWESIYEVEVVK